MPRFRIHAALLFLTFGGQFVSQLVADEIVIGNRPDQRAISQLGLPDENSEHTRLITTGELWQFFHSQGVTSVDRIKLNVDCGDQDPSRVGSIGFQIQDPANGHVLTHLKLNAANNQLEIPLEFDYMKRFSPSSQELIRLDLSDLDTLAQSATVTVDGEGSFFGPFNLVLVVSFLMFWVLVFFVLNRFTRPIVQEQVEDIVVVSANAEDSNPIGDQPFGNTHQTARSATANVVTNVSGVGSGKMVSAQ
jgi:hypothetical protein